MPILETRSHISDLNQAIKDYSEFLADVNVWNNSKEPFGHIDGQTETNYIYEFYCLMRILKDLSQSYKIRFDVQENMFPKAPANKKGWSKFWLHDKETNTPLFQVCLGTRIHTELDENGATPDISFQLSEASDRPFPKDVVFILDAKYTIKSDQSLKMKELRNFGMVLIDLEVNKVEPGIIKFNEFKTITLNSLLTNCNAHHSKKAYTHERGFKQVGKFDVGEEFEVV